MLGPAPMPTGIRALLGPTNTGKTYRAVERMLEHRSAMIGLPLRLLAREVYDRLCERAGEDSVALITGEEKLVPSYPRYWVCTVEAMPLSREVDFVVIDEIQMIADRQRGHVFCDRLLHARGRLETWFLGAETARELIETLVPTVQVDKLQRLSQLRAHPPVSLGALRPRTAVVAFSVEAVYELAERLRLRRGGAAVVLGALSPRARNAQVAMYQAGEVDYLVATDAIGMGLNLDIDHVVFAGRAKFDGETHRPLERQELAQIAGRAGRNQSDGHFSVLSPLPDFGRDTIRALEEHRFPRLTRAKWRNSELDFGSVDALVASLQRRPPAKLPLVSAAPADDYRALLELVRRPDIAERAKSPHLVELLWRVCQVPDFRKLLVDRHSEMLAQVYLQLSGAEGRIDEAWMAGRIAQIDDIDAGIDLLMTRMAFIRTWAYITGQAGWVRDAERWRRRTREVEDRLSDALHEALVFRFVRDGGSSRTRVGGRNPKTKAKTRRADPRPDVVDGPFAGLASLRDAMSEPVDDGAVASEAWVDALCRAPHEAFVMDARGRLHWRDAIVARLKPGRSLLHPNLALEDEARLPTGARRRVHERLQAWTRQWLSRLLTPLDDAADAGDGERGLMYALRSGLGCVARSAVDRQLGGLPKGRRASLRERGVVIGRSYVYSEPLLHAQSRRERLVLAWAQLGALGAPPAVPADGGCLVLGGDFHSGVYLSCGYVPVLGRGVSVDACERLLEQVDRAARGAEYSKEDARLRLSKMLGTSVDVEQLEDTLYAWGWRWDERSPVRVPRRSTRRRGRA